jgi:hypothetical protein
MWESPAGCILHSPSDSREIGNHDYPVQARVTTQDDSMTSALLRSVSTKLKVKDNVSHRHSPHNHEIECVLWNFNTIGAEAEHWSRI